jgi:hypothetical protein
VWTLYSTSPHFKHNNEQWTDLKSPHQLIKGTVQLRGQLNILTDSSDYTLTSDENKWLL